jgi:hypothetical protein
MNPLLRVLSTGIKWFQYEADVTYIHTYIHTYQKLSFHVNPLLGVLSTGIKWFQYETDVTYIPEAEFSCEPVTRGSIHGNKVVPV